jgi:hypothetical protein
MLSGVFEIYGRTPERLNSVNATAELLSLSTHTAVLSAPAELQGIKVADGNASRGGRILLPLEGVPPGHYLVRARVHDGRETVAELLRDVHVVAGSPPPAPPPSAAAAVPFRPVDVLSGDIARRYVAALRSRAEGGNRGRRSIGSPAELGRRGVHLPGLRNPRTPRLSAA